MANNVDPETGLTNAREIFAQAFARDGSAINAYREAFPNNNMSALTMSRKAYDLTHDVRIQARVAQIKSSVKDSALIKMDEHLKALGVLRNKAAEAKQFSAAITAEVNRGKASGLYVERVEQNVNVNRTTDNYERMTTEELKQEIKKRMLDVMS